MARSYLSLGSNLGDRLYYLRRAAHLIKQECGEEVAASRVYETEPVGYLNQGRFLNAVLEIRTVLSPRELLERCLEIEKRLNRKRLNRFGPRTIDIDILTYDDLKLESPELIIPHPRMRERAFVLVPLLELAPDLRVGGDSVKSLVKRLPKKDLSDVRLTDYVLLKNGKYS